MIFSLDVMRARKGDCLMLHYGAEDDLHHIIIDGGPKAVFGPFLKPRLEQVRTALALPDDPPLDIECLMVSHVDDDHIQGVLDLTKELITRKKEKKPAAVQIFNFWHNSFEDIIDATPDELTAAFSTQSVTASVGGDPPDDLDLEVEDEDEETVVSTVKVLASIKQGQQLRSDVINALQVNLNAETDGKLIMAQENVEAFDMGNGLSFRVVGPMLPELQQLQKDHQKWLKELADQGKTPADVLSAYVDKSVPNNSSIVVLAECDGRKILLTGDARGDKILKGLELTGLVDKGGTFKIDILKVPHHGSSNNLDNDFFERIHANHYVFSGNGEHGNPERESLEMLLNARGDENYTIHLTYPIDEIDTARKAEWEKQQASEKTKQAKNPAKKVRENWSADKHSLAAMFAANPDFLKKVSIVAENEPHMINLLDDPQF
ncbi:MAG TPA: MBL fold metallo-hydrolase [Pyrinomonadaceae bacterium]|jgi:hypothetical protein|nr:MBL fold metallo-hydrolase [Pyrinomonadaceae bacterium]